MISLRLFALMSITALSACSMEGVDGDSGDGLIQITHTERGTLYWE